MAQQTQPYKRTLSGSIGAGMGSLFNADGKRFYILEHKVSSQYHRAGESQRIIVDQIELGRDASCQVRFDESFKTVSRRHAAIVKDGDNWKLVQLSQTNSTFLNGHPIASEWYLQNGDEIQLSVNGPKLGFIIPAGDKSLVKSIGLTARLNLFGQQALRPYKRAIAAICTVFVLAVAGLVTGLVMQKGEIDIANTKVSTAQEELNQLKTDYTAAVDSLTKVIGKQQADIKKLRTDVKKVVKPIGVAAPTNTTIQGMDLSDCMNEVYFIYGSKITVCYQGETKVLETGWTGTGFFTNDGKFITAHHVIHPWFFPTSENDLIMNQIVAAGGTVVAEFDAYSSTGDRFSFTSDNFICGALRDETEDGCTFRLPKNNAADWAYMRRSHKGKGLAYDANLSYKLQAGTNLTVLGFPHGLGANSASDIQPILASCQVGKTGLDNGMILLSNASIEHGNSGGPVFVADQEGNMVVIGLVSTGIGRSLSGIVPIKQIQQ